MEKLHELRACFLVSPAVVQWGRHQMLGDRYLDVQRGRLDPDQPAETGPPEADPLRDLGISPREGEVLVLLAQGRTNRQIAQELYQ